jgi:tetratricopeptide (TPR) repeat protein
VKGIHQEDETPVDPEPVRRFHSDDRLRIRFPDRGSVVVDWADGSGPVLDFRPPLHAVDYAEIRWYLEVYPIQHTTDADDLRAARIEARLEELGSALFRMVFQNPDAVQRFEQWTASRSVPILSIAADDPLILALPWELLSGPEGGFLAHRSAPISIRRAPLTPPESPLPAEAPLRSLRLLFVVSRPTDAAFIDPRTESAAILDALEQTTPGRVMCEFVRPATVAALAARLADTSLPSVDVVHFDGHGYFDFAGTMAGKTERLPGTGYLCFENPFGRTHWVAAEELGERLRQGGVKLVVLSACHSASVTGNEPFGCMAAGLVRTGVPAVVAMAHAALVTTTCRLSASFYGALSRGESVGTALDEARQTLYRHPEKHPVERSGVSRPLRLLDWFVPTLFEAAHLPSLLTPREDMGGSAVVLEEDRRSQEFFGRAAELHAVERWFSTGVRRVTIHGFAGAGKTALALEAGRWLQRTGMFQRVVLVDYLAFASVDPVEYAVGAVSAVLEVPSESAPSALSVAPTLLILDGIDALEPGARHLLLEAAREWSETGFTCVIVTSRSLKAGFVATDSAEAASERSLLVQGLAAEDALGWLQARIVDAHPLATHEALAALCVQADFHPSCLAQLAVALQSLTCSELVPHFDQVLLDAGGPVNVASVRHVLQCVPQAVRERVPALGMFQSGGPEILLCRLSEFSDEDWSAVCSLLEEASLIRVELIAPVESVDLQETRFIRFHPVLAAVLRHLIPVGEVTRLELRFRSLHWGELRVLADLDLEDRVYAAELTRLELPNLLAALDGCYHRGKRRSAVELACLLAPLLLRGGLVRDARAVLERALEHADETGSRLWYVTRLRWAQHLLYCGDPDEAERVLRELSPQTEVVSYTERCSTLLALADALRLQGQCSKAVDVYGQARQLADYVAFRSYFTHACILAELGATLLSASDLNRASSTLFDASVGYLQAHSRGERFITGPEPDTSDQHQRRLRLIERERARLNALHGRLSRVPVLMRPLRSLMRAMSPGLGRRWRVLTEILAPECESGFRSTRLEEVKRGEQLYRRGEIREAAKSFRQSMSAGEAPLLFDDCCTLARVGHALAAAGESQSAVEALEEALVCADQLDQEAQTIHVRILTNLSRTLLQLGEVRAARQACTEAASIAQWCANERMAQDVRAQLAAIAIERHDFARAERLSLEDLRSAERRREPIHQAEIHRRLGIICLRARRDEAERHFRVAAALSDEAGDARRAAEAWIQLGSMAAADGLTDVAEVWFSSAVDAALKAKHVPTLAEALDHYAGMLVDQTARVGDAHLFASQALELKQQLMDPRASQLWRTYEVLSRIAQRLGQPEEAVLFAQAASNAEVSFGDSERRNDHLMVGMVGLHFDTSSDPEVEDLLWERQRLQNGGLSSTLDLIIQGQHSPTMLRAHIEREIEHIRTLSRVRMSHPYRPDLGWPVTEGDAMLSGPFA